MYFTTYPEYAAFSYSLDPDESVLILAYVIPGNAYPGIDIFPALR